MIQEICSLHFGGCWYSSSVNTVSLALCESIDVGVTFLIFSVSDTYTSTHTHARPLACTHTHISDFYAQFALRYAFRLPITILRFVRRLVKVTRT